MRGKKMPNKFERNIQWINERREWVNRTVTNPEERESILKKLDQSEAALIEKKDELISKSS